MSSEKVRTALDIRQEPAAMRDRYGRHLFGQSTLVARRLVEAGTRFVTVGWDAPDGYGWDSHLDSNDVRDHLDSRAWTRRCPRCLADLDDRGLLDETLVVAVGEMGRTPKATGTWGRGHWSTLFPAVVAGAGVRGGTVYGTSDATPPTRSIIRPVPRIWRPRFSSAWASIPSCAFTTLKDRPVPLVEGGRVIREILA